MSNEKIIKDVEHIKDCCDQNGPWAKTLGEAIALLRTHQDAQTSEPQGDGWIRVTDRLPETGVPVLIHNQHWAYGVVANYAGSGVWMNTWYQRMTWTPTHWLPLPEPPKEA